MTRNPHRARSTADADASFSVAPPPPTPDPTILSRAALLSHSLFPLTSRAVGLLLALGWMLARGELALIAHAGVTMPTLLPHLALIGACMYGLGHHTRMFVMLLCHLEAGVSPHPQPPHTRRVITVTVHARGVRSSQASFSAC